jgi:hypothetical protein
MCRPVIAWLDGHLRAGVNMRWGCARGGAIEILGFFGDSLSILLLFAQKVINFNFKSSIMCLTGYHTSTLCLSDWVSYMACTFQAAL